MTVVLPFFQGDVPRLSDLLVWIGQLGGCKNHSALLVADAGTQWSDCISIRQHAEELFLRAELVCTTQSVKGWPQGANALFKYAANLVGMPFLWLEPDAIPLKSGWLDDIEVAYRICGKAILGRNGIAVYPANTSDVLGAAIRENEAFDVSISKIASDVTADTDLIQFEWGSPKVMPTFTDLSSLSPKAVLFHRNKDGTLINLLRKRLFQTLCKLPFTVVLSFFRGDAEQAHQTLEWIARLKTPATHPILICFEQGVPSALVQEIIKSAHKSFTAVRSSQYRRPLRGTFAPTMAFIHAAHTMAKMGKPWLWMEPDTIPIKSNWLSTLQEEYDTCGKPFCGPIVPHRGHMNGTGIYPANTPELIPKTMRAYSQVWDWHMKDEMIASCHDCSRIFFHTWGVIDGKLNPIEGPDPHFNGTGLLKQIPESAVIMHRCKDGSLISELEKTLKV